MNFKHFIKTLLIFSGIIFLGLLGIFLLNYFDKNNKSDINTFNVFEAEE